MKYLFVLFIGLVSCGGNMPASKYQSDNCFDLDSCKQACDHLNDKQACRKYYEIDHKYRGLRLYN